MYKLRPSKAHMWSVCAGYTAMTEKFPEIDGTTDTTVREEGTAAHWAAHQMSLGDWVTVGDVAPNGVELNEELIDGACTFISEVNSWGVPAQHELTMPARYIHEDCGGTPDAFGFHENLPRPLIRLSDLKMGYRVVDPFENMQLAIYLSAILDYLGINGHTEQFVDVEFSIVQPRAFGRMGGPITRWRTAAVNFRGLFNKLKMAARATMEPDAPLQSGAHCLDCSAAWSCPALRKSGGTVLGMLAQQIPHVLDAPALGVALAMVQDARTIIEALDNGLQIQARHMMGEGAVIPGYAMEPTTGRLTWNEGVAEEVVAVAKLLGIDVVKPLALITPTQAKSAKLPEAIVKEFAQRKQNGMKLTRVRENTIRKLFEGS